MDAFFERLIVRTATIDELLSDDFEPLHGQKADSDRSAQRLAAWCRACASGDWSLFVRRLERDGLWIEGVLKRLATVRRRAAAATPAWIEDAMWIEGALTRSGHQPKPVTWPEDLDPCPFESLFVALVDQAEARLWSNIDGQVSDHLNATAQAALRHSLMQALTGLGAPALYERFAKLRRQAANNGGGEEPQTDVGSLLDRFIADLRAGGLRQLFEEKPVLLRLIAVVTRQWIDTSREFVLRLATDLNAIRTDLIRSAVPSRVAMIEGDLSDPHNGGHSVQIVRFEDGARVVYKPKDLRLDAVWHALVERLNGTGAPVELKAVRVLTRDGYGWTEFIGHADFADPYGANRFFRRAGAWLALFHCFAGYDMHQENMLATGDHPVPIDLEMILQAAPDEQKSSELESQAFETAMETVGNSVMMVGLLPAYGKSPENKVYAIGGMTSDWSAKARLAWTEINNDKMRPARAKRADTAVPNLPHSGGRQAKLGDHVEDFIGGFEDYATYLIGISRDMGQGGVFDGFAGLPVRKVVRPTRFYYMLLLRLRNHRTMDDGALWSAQADFLARLSNWENDGDILWPLQRGERAALVAQNVPHFVSSSDGQIIADATGATARTTAEPGLQRARARLRAFDAKDVAWQVAVIRQSTANLSRSDSQRMMKKTFPKLLRPVADAVPQGETFVAEANRIADELNGAAVRRGPGAAWIGLDWLGDSEMSQLVTLGAELYNGNSGIGLFLAAHAAVTGRESSRELALAAVAQLRAALHGRNAARTARSFGLGGASGLGSIVYALAVMAKCLGDANLMADAHAAAALFTDDLIAADKQLDVLGGSAGAILGLLRLYRDGQSGDVLMRATRCGEHLLAQPRRGTPGARSWLGLGAGAKPLNGMSHGAAGFAYALASLAAVTGREEFAAAAAECIAFEDASYDADQANWPDFRLEEELTFPCQWCHGAPGVGLSRIGMSKRGVRHGGPNSSLDVEFLANDIRKALTGVERGWPAHVDTMCCGTLGSIEFFCEAGDALARTDLRDIAARRMLAVIESAAATGDYRWNIGGRRFNLGLFRGLAGVGYSCLRRADNSLPNVLILE